MRVLVCISTVLAACMAHAQTYPTKPIRLLVPFCPGGVGDITSRAVMQKMGEAMNQQIIIDNRPSAGGIVATETVAKSEPDGYTLYLMNNTNAVSGAMFKKLPYDTVKDFAMVSTIGAFSLAVLVSPDSPVKTVKELIAQANANPGKFNIGTINIGTTQYLAGELLKSMANLDAATVPFNNTAGVLTALRGNSVQVAVEFLPPVLGQLRANSLRAIAVTSLTRFRAATQRTDSRGERPARIRSQFVERHRRRCKNAEGNRRAAQQGNPCGSQFAADQAALRRTRRRTEPFDARRHAKTVDRRNRQVERAHRQGEDSAVAPNQSKQALVTSCTLIWRSNSKCEVVSILARWFVVFTVSRSVIAMSPAPPVPWVGYPLHAAVNACALNMVRDALEAGSDPNQLGRAFSDINSKLVTPFLAIALGKGAWGQGPICSQLEIVRDLLSRGASLEGVSPKNSEIPIEFTIRVLQKF